MELEHRRDFDQVAERWDAYWRAEDIGRAYISITVPKAGVEPPKRPSLQGYAGEDIGPIAEQMLRWTEAHEFYGEALPFFHVFFGPDHLAAVLGVDLTVHPDSPGTSWPVHFVEDWDDVAIAPQWDGLWWQRTAECIEACRKRCDGKLLISIPTLQGGLDCLAAFRGAEGLLMDLVMVPEKVAAAVQAVNVAFDEVNAALASLCDVETFGSINRHGMHCRGTTNVPQCDVSCMMSPAMFREFGLPAIAHEAKTLDAADYHLDGPGAIKHLDAICEIPEIAAIQWQPGSGEAAEMDWTDLYKRIDSLGKGHVITTAPENIPRLAEVLHSRQLFFSTTATSRQEAEALLAKLDAISR